MSLHRELTVRCRQPRLRSGFSLVEVLVFCLLLGMLISGLYLLLIGGLRMVQNGQAYQTAQQQALVAARKIVGEVSDARGDTALLLYQGPPQGQSRASAALVFLSGFPRFPAPQDHLQYDATTGLVNWQKWVGYYLVQNTTTNLYDLMRAENLSGLGSGVVFNIGTPSPATPAFPPGGTWAHAMPVAHNIYEFDVQGGPVGNPPSLVISIYSQDATSSGTRVDSQNLTQVIYQLHAWLSN